MRPFFLALTAVVALASPDLAGLAANNGALQPGSRGPVIQTQAPAPTPTLAPLVMSA